jgi:TolB-like protein/Tfp pilus assembly protein PilF
MADIFLSYKAEDRARVKPLVDAFNAEGLTVWWDVHIEGGAGWRQTIERELDGAACVVVVWSADSVGPEGHFVHDEAARGQRRGVILPVTIDAVRPPLGFGQQALSLIGWRGNRRDPRFADVLAAAKAVVAGGPRPMPTARERSVGRKRWSLIRSGAVGGAVAAVALGLIVVRAPARLCQAAGLSCLGAPAAAPADSVAVLPFANLSGDPGQDYFSDGLSEELISTLARIKPLHVAGRTSSFKFKGSKETTAAIGAQLGVAFLLDGSVRRDGELVRVSAQLADAKTGFERWSQTYDRDMKDIFAVQSGIAQAVAEALKVQLFGADIAALSRNGTLSPEAYDSYLRGRRLFEDGAGEAGYRAALARFDAAIAADPRYASAYAGRAATLLQLANQFTPAANLRATYDDALVSARRAVELAPDLATAQAILASTLVYADHDFAGARPAYARAAALGGGNASVLVGYGLFACQLGDCDTGVTALRRAASLDPLSPETQKTLAQTLIGARRYPEAIGALRRALALSPNMDIAHAWLGDALMLQGKLADAKAEYALEPVMWARLTGQAIVLRRLGDTAGARAALRALTADGDASAYQEAQVYAQWGDTPAAFQALDTAIRLDDSGLLMLKVDPLLEPLRGDPRFAVRLQKVGLPARA